MHFYDFITEERKNRKWYSKKIWFFFKMPSGKHIIITKLLPFKTESKILKRAYICGIKLENLNRGFRNIIFPCLFLGANTQTQISLHEVDAEWREVPYKELKQFFGETCPFLRRRARLNFNLFFIKATTN